MGDIVLVDFKSEAIDRNIEANCAAFIVVEIAHAHGDLVDYSATTSMRDGTDEAWAYLNLAKAMEEYAASIRAKGELMAEDCSDM